MNKTVIIKGSSRKEGNTQKAINYLKQHTNFDVIDLLDYQIGPFHYQFNNSEDDFIPLLERITAEYNTLIFVTPVYWYTMSGTMKIFLDRFSDLLHYRKDLGRTLRGKSMAMMSNSGANDRKAGFDMPFVESAKYLGMDYLGDVHAWFDGTEIHPDAKKSIDTFREILTEN
jgi:multimeric flavodoxin WrbA